MTEIKEYSLLAEMRHKLEQEINAINQTLNEIENTVLLERKGITPDTITEIRAALAESTELIKSIRENGDLTTLYEKSRDRHERLAIFLASHKNSTDPLYDQLETLNNEIANLQYLEIKLNDATELSIDKLQGQKPDSGLDINRKIAIPLERKLGKLGRRSGPLA